MDITSYILSKKYIEDSLAGAGALKGKSAYEIACENGFKGTPNEWLDTLKGSTPQIGPSGTWIIDDYDTGIIASPSLAGYATQDYVELLFNSVPKVDLTPYATRKELSEAILGITIPDVSNFTTREELDNAIKNIVFPETDLSDYPTRKEVKDAIDAIPKPDLSPFATKEEVRNAIDAIPEIDLSDYAKKTDLPSLEGLASESYVEEKIQQIEFPTTDLTGYATEDYVQRKITEAQLDEKEVDLSNFYTKSEVDQKIDNIDIPKVDLTGIATEQFVREIIQDIDIPSTDGLASEDYVNQRIEEINIPSTEGLATKEYVNESIAGIKHPTIDLSKYITKDQLEDYATEEFVNTIINDIMGIAPDELNTLEELATAIKNNESWTEALNDLVAKKADKTDLKNFVTETIVRQLINEAQLSSEVDLSSYYTKSEVDKKLDEIEHPAADLSGYATEDYVDNAINGIQIPSTEGLASTEYVDEAISNIELPDVTGLATETYVDEAIAAIEIPEAKSDVKVYEISSDSAVLDELVALLPEGIVINQGDVILVTNTLGVKSAYQYDEGWIACDGNVDASRVIMPFDITLAGSYTQVGNLSKTSTGTATFATRGKSVAAALQEMLSKREQPSIKTQPKVTLTATSGAKEVGTEVTPTWSASLGAGEYTYGPATGIVAKTWVISDTDGHSASTASGSFAKFTVGDDTNYRITAKATYDDGAVAQDNLGDPSNPTVKIAAGSKSANGNYITGYRSWFMYVGESLDAIDSAFIRGTTNKGATPSTQSGVTIPAGTKRVMVAIPANGSNLTSVIDVDGMGLDVFGNFTKINVDVEGLNGYKATSYDVWVAENENGLAATHYNLVIG